MEYSIFMEVRKIIKYCIFGAGYMGKMCYKMFSEQFDIVCFCDNDMEKQKGMLYGLPVIAQEDIIASDLMVIIACGAHFEIAQQLINMGIKEFYLFQLDAKNKINLIDLTSYDDLTLNPMRVCIIETPGTGGNANAILKYNPYEDIDIVVIELGIYDSIERIYRNIEMCYAFFTSALFITQNLTEVCDKKCIELWHGFPIKALSYMSNDSSVKKYSNYVSDLMNNRRVVVCSYSKLG